MRSQRAAKEMQAPSDENKVEVILSGLAGEEFGRWAKGHINSWLEGAADRKETERFPGG